MNENVRPSLEEICGQLSEQTLPRWNDLPDLELYMDQVLALIQRYLGAYPAFDGKALTASMVNNYVKLGVMPPPVKKKYTRTHLAYLVVICILKTSLPIACIQKIVAHEMPGSSEKEIYDRFCETFERVNRIAVESTLLEAESYSTELSPLYHAAIMAQAEQTLALRLCGVCFMDGKKEKTN